MNNRLMLAASAAILIAACAKQAADDAVAEPAADAAVVADDAAVVADDAAIAEPMIEAADDQSGFTAWAEITLDAKGQPAFGASGGGGCANGRCFSGINLAAAGNIDLSGFPPGDVAITIKFDDKTWAAGYRYPGDIWQTIGIAVVPPGSITSPLPGFGQKYWPAEFDAPTFSGDQRQVIFVDKEDDVDVYEYAINLKRPDGSINLLDPTINNGGHNR